MNEQAYNLNTSMTEINHCMIVSIADGMNDQELDTFAEIISATSSHRIHIRGVLFNFSMVKILDSYGVKVFGRLTKSIKLMGRDVVWVGLKPGVVISLIDLNLDVHIPRVKTALNLKDGLELLAKGESRE